MEVRIATPDDLDGIMRVEEEAFGGVGDDAMASRETMAHRIALLNSGDQGWCWVAVHEGVIVGTNVVQPTNLTPADQSKVFCCGLESVIFLASLR